MEASSTASEPDSTPAEPRDWIPWLLGVAAFVAVIVATSAFALSGFRISSQVVRAAPWVVLASVVIAVRVTTPNSRLAPDRRRRRERRTEGALIGFLIGVAIVSAVAAAFYLNSPDQWLVFGVFCAGAFGVLLMLRARFSIGPG